MKAYRGLIFLIIGLGTMFIGAVKFGRSIKEGHDKQVLLDSLKMENLKLDIELKKNELMRGEL